MVATKAAAPADSTQQAGSDVTKPATVNGANDLSDGDKVILHKKAPQSQLRRRVEASLNQARTSKAPPSQRSHRH
ncbi:hypothetical protein MSAR_29060 [Mycolicibacterium sarraceniae]|uniref:Uncharacterized protein n=1 Tax=Mycolicibacterium sarraceniae TaxID=1534348 RepID=A0A7I7ST31_9MYCO|nr:hypothetical protein MSAR_29060 [Mycolicibacterium sarraceniae]